MDSISLNQTTGKQTTDTIVDDAVDGMPGLESTSKKCKSKELTSDVWNFFTKIGVDADGKLASRKVDPNIARELLASAVIKHDLPFSFVEYDGIRKWQKYLNPDVPSISRNTLVSDITKIYFQEKEKLKQVAIKYKRAFASLQLNDRHYKFCHSNEEWKRGEKICEFLEPFYEVTNLISGSSYPTSNLYFMQVWKIESMLKDNLHNEDVLICDMCKKMFEKFDKYWSEYSIVLAFGAIFDPRIKLVTLEHLYEELENDTIKVQDMISRVKTKLNKLFSAYADVVTPRPSQPRFSQVSSSSMQREGVGKAIKKYDSQSVKTIGKSELDIYLEEPKLEYAYYEDLNILDYWKERMHRYPALALMARDVLAIPIITVASESAFSMVSCAHQVSELLLCLKKCKLLFALEIGCVVMLWILKKFQVQHQFVL
nr:zinc finger BED domain-containing protein RICESLEEPER 2-like [Ipomoea batatas]